MDMRLIQQRIAAALAMATDTRHLRLGDGVLGEAAEVFGRCFDDDRALLVADTNTFRAAGGAVAGVLRGAGIELPEALVFEEPSLHADYEHVELVKRAIETRGGVPVAVGSGTINDLTKLAAHECGRPYMVVATAASMDGYTAYGASVIRDGSKQTFFCPAPRAVIADLEVICAAPGELNAAGYADLLAKTTAGADWLLADALDIEAIDVRAWDLVQSRLHDWTGNPECVRRGDRDTILGLVEGLMMTGFAMQWCKSSRPASGAEHQFSHLWDMQGHTYRGRVPLHGHKVGIGTLAVTLLYERLMAEPLAEIDWGSAGWPDLEELRRLVELTHEKADLRAVAWRESQAKHMDRETGQLLLERIRTAWPGLRHRLHEQLVPADEVGDMLRAAGAPNHPADIGIDPARLRRSYIEAQQIRRRFTVLDVAVLTGCLVRCLDAVPLAGGRAPAVVGSDECRARGGH
ncbi:MAG TPA: sn-glycerol-1-phosphate dehydrogenase [Phycisphaerae bacterium]|nr:sn-glycerol-1-phosphate dehydrogenase [Phycisphaerae bacterium]HRY67560.1 sn-glycerol-1-phosphate dehydrogenase [Phycisphaerae bacterium]